MNPALWLYRIASARPDAGALYSGAKLQANYGEFAAEAARIGAWLAAQKIGRGDRVAVFAANSVDYLQVLYGIWWAGAAAVPINAKLHAREAQWILDHSGARMMFGDVKTCAAMTDIGGIDLPLVNLSERVWADVQDLLDRPVSMDPDALLWLFYTSGTTGRPKGVMITCANISAMVASYLLDVDDAHTEDAILYAAPMSHGAGLYNFMHVLRGARHVVPASGGFDAAELLDLAPQVGPVSMFAAPTMVRRMIDAAKGRADPGAGLRSIIYAGGPMYEADILEAVDIMGPRFIQIYGQGECPMGITALSRADVADRTHPRWRQRLNSVGRAQSQVEVAILDAAGHPLPVGDVGEIAVRGATVMAGYWQNSQATAKTIQKGWLWTGDMGRLDADGYLTLHDRSKDMIISGGSNIYPREVEEQLLSHPSVHEVSVVGQSHAEWGEIVVAFVVLADGAQADPAALDQHCLTALARFKRPKTYHFVDSLPKNNYGKVLKTELRARLEGADKDA